MKVDLTKYVEQHSFTFDEVFDLDADNHEVSQMDSPRGRV